MRKLEIKQILRSSTPTSQKRACRGPRSAQDDTSQSSPDTLGRESTLIYGSPSQPGVVTAGEGSGEFVFGNRRCSPYPTLTVRPNIVQVGCDDHVDRQGATGGIQVRNDIRNPIEAKDAPDYAHAIAQITPKVRPTAGCGGDSLALVVEQVLVPMPGERILLDNDVCRQRSD